MARVYLLAGLLFGDESKGSFTDFLTRSTGAKLIVRYNGGSNCGHNVVLPDGTHHCFSQFGSGSFVPGVETHLSRHMMVNPIFMLSEAKHLIQVGQKDIWERMSVDREALVTNPFQVAANRLREMIRDAEGNRHGSCGMGIGETMADALAHPNDVLRVGDLLDRSKTELKLRLSQERKAAEFKDLLREESPLTDRVGFAGERELLIDPTWPYDLANGLYRDWVNKVRLTTRDYLTWVTNESGVVIFEGAQGVLLDENFGFHPHTTWSTTTFQNAYDLLQDHNDEQTRVGVLRSYMTRHGAGPFVTEDSELKLEGEHNVFGEWQQGFRVGHLDLMMVHYALKILGGVDLLALSHMDKVQDTWKVCQSYGADLGLESMLLLPDGNVDLVRQEKIGRALKTAKPVYQDLSVHEVLSHLKSLSPNLLYSYGPTFENKAFHARHL
jgi:adenylosuccinate synthase